MWRVKAPQQGLLFDAMFWVLASPHVSARVSAVIAVAFSARLKGSRAREAKSKQFGLPAKIGMSKPCCGAFHAPRAVYNSIMMLV